MNTQNTMFNQIQIQTKTGCNLKCPMCPLSRITQPVLTLSGKLFTKILKELSNIDYKERISLYLMNEPFRDERLIDMIAETRERLPDVRINISTNGIIPTIDDMKRLKEVGLSDCDVSCYTQAIYDKWKDQDVNAINMIGYQYHYNNRGGNSSAGKGREVGGYCERPFVQMYVNAFGQAILCCSDYKFEVVMGDLNKNTLMEIWNNKKYKRYRKVLKTGNRKGLTLCQTCNY